MADIRAAQAHSWSGALLTGPFKSHSGRESASEESKKQMVTQNVRRKQEADGHTERWELRMDDTRIA